MCSSWFWEIAPLFESIDACLKDHNYPLAFHASFQCKDCARLLTLKASRHRKDGSFLHTVQAKCQCTDCLFKQAGRHYQECGCLLKLQAVVVESTGIVQ